MEGYRVRRGGTERGFTDLAAVQAAAGRGEIRAGDEVWTDAGWVRADTHPSVRSALRGADPWSAWSDVDAHDAASVYKQMVEAAEPEELPAEALRLDEPVSIEPASIEPDPTTEEPPPPRLARPSPPAHAPESVEDETDARPTARLARPTPLAGGVRPPTEGRSGAPRDGGQLIDFPNRPPRRPRPAPPPTVPIVRTSRVVAMLVAGALVLGLGYAWIQVGAYSSAGLSEPAAPKAPPEAAPISPLIALDADIRKLLTPTPREVKEAGDLSDALLVELIGARIEVVEANGLVTKWVGRHADEPKVAEVRIQYRSAGDMSRELGTIALIVGRYKRLFRLDMPVFDVTEVGTGGVTHIDANKAEAYYQARLSLEGFLQSIAGGPAPAERDPKPPRAP